MFSLRRLAWLVASAGVLALFAGAGLGLAPSTEAAVTILELNLTGAAENPPVTGGGSGVARLQYDDVSRVLRYDVTTSGITPSNVTMAHIHRGAVGVNGPIVYPLTMVSPGVFSGQVTFTDADVADLNAGLFYVNVHSVAHPGGFARAQINIGVDAAIRASLEQTAAAWNARDAEAFLAGYTDAGVISAFDAPRQVALTFVPEFIGSSQLTIRSLKLLSQSGNAATVEVEVSFGVALQTIRFDMVLEGGRWKINNETELATPIPANVTAVNMQLSEFSFSYDKNAVTSGNFAFRVQNVGEQPHEIILARLAPSVNLQEALQSEGPPEGVDILATGGPWEPGVNTNMVLTQPLSAGRYALLCFIPDEATELPHAALGMVSEFNVGGGGGTIRPPSTGDAGLMQSSTTVAGLLLTGVLLLSLGGGMLVLSRRRA